MLNRLLPYKADNHYQGHKSSLWVFGVLLSLLAAMSLNSIFNGHYVAVNADGLPLGSYTPGGAQAVVSFYATWGVTQLLLVIVGILILIRYRTLVPAFFLLFLLEQFFLRMVPYFRPVAKPHGTPASTFVIILFSLLIVGLALSLWKRKGAE